MSVTLLAPPATFAAFVIGVPLVLTMLKPLDAAYLAWLCYGAARGALRGGLFFNLLTTRAALARIATLGSGQGAGVATLPAVIACAILGLVLNLGYAMLSSLVPVMRGCARARRWIEGILAILFSGAPLKILTGGAA